MADVAADAGVSRQTVYNEFGDKAGLAEAMVRREVSQFLIGVQAALDAHPGDVRAAVYAAVYYTLTEAAVNPLIKMIVASAQSGDSLLPWLTTRAEALLLAAMGVLRGYAARELPGVPETDIEVGAEAIVRLVLSNIVMPLAPPERTAAAIAELAIRFISGSH